MWLVATIGDTQSHSQFGVDTSMSVPMYLLVSLCVFLLSLSLSPALSLPPSLILCHSACLPLSASLPAALLPCPTLSLLYTYKPILFSSHVFYLLYIPWTFSRFSAYRCIWFVGLFVFNYSIISVGCMDQYPFNLLMDIRLFSIFLHKYFLNYGL